MPPVVIELPVIEPVNAAPLLIMLVFVALDVIFGLCKAFATHTFDSSKMRQGLWHKCALIGCELMAYCVEVVTQLMDFTAIGMPDDFVLPIVGAVTGYIVVMELGSILESLCVINPELAGGRIIGQFDKLLKGARDEASDEQG